MRLQEGSRKRAFQGTFVVSSASGAQSSARIWHVCDGEQQLERVDALTGPPRSTFRRNADVVTFWPRAGVAQTEKREALAVFPGFLQTTDNAIARFYTVKLLGADRVAGLQSDLIELVPQDGYRYGYRVWSEKSTGMLLKVQTMDAAGRVMEQSAFSEVELDAPVSMETLKTAMGRTEGYRMVERCQRPGSQHCGSGRREPVGWPAGRSGPAPARCPPVLGQSLRGGAFSRRTAATGSAGRR